VWFLALLVTGTSLSVELVILWIGRPSAFVKASQQLGVP